MENQERNMSPEELERLNKEREAFAEADDIRAAKKKAKTKKIILIAAIAFVAIALITSIILIFTVNHTYVLDYGYGDEGRISTNYYKLLDDDIILENPERVGYTFIGWTGTDLEIPTKDLVIKKFSSGDKNYFANWAANEYKVTLDADGGEGVPTYIVLEYGELYKLEAPTKDGYKFLGWFDGEKEFPMTETWTGLQDKALKAKWETTEYHIYLDGVAEGINVIYDRNYVGSLPSTEVVLNGETLSPWMPTRSGYLFMGWYTDAECTTKYDFSTEITTDLTLYANWVEMTLPEGEDYEHVKGFSQTQINPARYDSTQSTTEIYSSYGKCVYFVVNETGSHSIYYRHDSNTPAIAVYNLTTKTEILEAINVTNENYAKVTFDCAAGDVVAIIIMPVSYYDTYVEMYFEGFTYPESEVNAPESDLIYTHGSSSSEIMDSEEFDPFDRIVNGNYISVDVKYGEEFELPVITRPGYTFDGWRDITAEDSEELFEAGKWDSTKNVYLRPSFTPNTYTLTFKLDGGSLDSETMTVEYVSFYELPIPTKENYTFKGWYIEVPDDVDAEDYDPDYDNDIEFGFTGTWGTLKDVELVAKWEGLSYKVTFENSIPDSYVTVRYAYNYSGASSTYYTTHPVHAGNTVPMLVPSRSTTTNLETGDVTAYLFNGWYTDAECKTKYDFTGTVREDLTLYADWSEFKVENVGYLAQIDPSTYTSEDDYCLRNIYGKNENYPYAVCFVADKTGTFEINYKYTPYFNSNVESLEDTYMMSVSNATTGAPITDGYIHVNSMSYNSLSFTANEGDIILIRMYNYNYNSGDSNAYFYFEGFDEEFVSKAIAEPGYTYSEGKTQQKDYVYGDEIVLPAMEDRPATDEHNGFKLLGWYNGNTKVESGVWTITSKVTFSPKWQAVE